MTTSKRILIADDDETFVDVLAQRFETCGLEVERAYDGMSALLKMQRIKPDLIILNVNMPHSSGLRICKLLSSDRCLKSIPVIVLTGRNDEKVRRMCNDLLVHYVPKGPGIWFRLEPLVIELMGLDRQDLAKAAAKHLEFVRHAHAGYSRFRAKGAPLTRSPVRSGREGEPRTCTESSLLADRIAVPANGAIHAMPRTEEALSPESANYDSRAPEMPRPWVLCVDDDRDFADSLKLRLRQRGVEVVQAFAGTAAYRTAFTSPAMAIILDQSMPDGNGDYVLRRLKESAVTQDIPVIVLTGRKDHMLERKMYNLGAARFLTKPVVWDDLWTELRRHIRLAPYPRFSARDCREV